MSPPNILFFLIDDMGWTDLACQGSDFYETPNLDQLAKDGMVFTNAYAACPVCSPTRASILSGKYPANVGVTDWINASGSIHPARGRLIDAPYLKYLPETEFSVAAALQAGGYATWHIGKWHCGGPGHYPQDHGFEINIGGCEAGSPGGGYFSPWGFPGLETGKFEGEYLTDHLSDRCVELIGKHDFSAQPVFINFWHYAVHTPIQAPEELVEKYRLKAERLGLRDEDALEEGELHPVEHKKDVRVVRRTFHSNATYAAMIENLDTNIGNVLQAIDDAGQRDNTLVIFTSDNGGLATSEGSPTCNAPLAEGKGWMYEGGTREPLIARWPGVIPPGSRCQVPVTSPDFYPTFLEVAGLSLRQAQHQDGVSILPLLKGGASIPREAIFWHYPHYGNQGGTPGSSIRHGDYKLIEFYEDGRLELYNLRDDISEETNLADQESGVVEMLHKELKAWRRKMNAKYPTANPHHIPWRDEHLD